jgi:two-component sensor histidine kinase
MKRAYVKTDDTCKQSHALTYLWTAKDNTLKMMVDDLRRPVYDGLFACDTLHDKTFIARRYQLYTTSLNSNTASQIYELPSRTLCIYADPVGILWLGCVNGLWSFSKGIFTYEGKDNPILRHRIDDIRVNKKGLWFMATRGNGVIIRKENNYTQVTTRQGLPSNNCECLHIDDRGTIWVGTKNGLCKLNERTDGQYDVTKLNLESEYFSRAIAQIEQVGNQLWIRTSNGIASYTLPDIQEKKNTPLRLYLKQFSVFDSDHLKDSVRDFSYSNNYVKISFVGLSYHSYGKIHYKYKLAGLDTTWHMTANTFIQYPFLPPGDYHFIVKAIAFDGYESKENCLVRFRIEKPIWLRTWFIALAIVLSLAVVYALFRIRLQSVRIKEEEKSAINSQLATLEMRALRAQMNPHFIFNAINSIQNHILKNDSRTAQDYLAKFARLIRNVLENSKTEYVPLFLELQTLRLYIELEQMRAPGKFVISISQDPLLSAYNTMIPPMLLQPFVENAILHGILPLEDNSGHLQISLNLAQDRLICIIEDNGIGRQKAGEIKTSKAISHRSLGLSVTEERIRILNRLHEGISGIQIQDLTDASGKAIGTRVTLHLPFLNQTN